MTVAKTLAVAVVVAAALAVAAAALHRPKAHELTADYSFAAYKAAWGKSYASAAEEAQREKLFRASLAEVLRFNAEPGHTWKKGINRFSDWTEEELRALRGGRFDPTFAHPLAKDYVPRGKTSGSVDYRTNFPPVVTAVKDQGECGDCWAHSVVEAIESSWALATGELFVLSTQQVTSCTPMTGSCYSCNGSYPSLGYTYVASAGLTEEFIYPFESYTGTFPACKANPFIPTPIRTIVNISGYVRVAANSQPDVLDALSNLGPLSVLVDASSWPAYESGIFSGCDYAQNISLDHAVNVVGYGTDPTSGLGYYLVRNSWAPSWGELGYIRLARPPTSECGWNVGAAYSSGCYGDGPAAVWTCGTCGVEFSPEFPIADTS